VISPTNATALDSWGDAIKRIMEVNKVNYTQAVNIAQQDPTLRPVWEAAKSARFSPLLTKAAPHGFRGQPDPPMSHTDPEESEDDLDEIDPKGRASHRRHPRVHKSLPAIVAALKRRYSDGGGVPR
jgi:hypothetical protein